MVKRTITYTILTLSLFTLSSISLLASQDPQAYVADPQPEQCGAFTNKNYLRHDNINQALACMQKGYKNVYLGRLADLKKVQDPNLRQFYLDLQKKNLVSFFGNNKNSDAINLIVSTPEGRSNASLLKKLSMEMDYLDYIWLLRGNPTLATTHENSYLFGLLLGYDKKDIEFFYQYTWLLSNPQNVPEIDNIKNVRLRKFTPLSEEEKQIFEQFFEQNKEYLAQMEQNKQAAEEWINSNKQWLQLQPNQAYTPYLNAFKDPYQFVTQSSQSSISTQPILPTSPSSSSLQETPNIKPPTSRWSQLGNAIMATGIFAGAAYLWKKYGYQSTAQSPTPTQ